MGAVLELLLLSVAMFVGCFISGKMAICLQGRVGVNGIQWLSVLGAGILLGTAITLILPEGVNALMEFQKKAATVNTDLPELEHLHDGPSLEFTIGFSILCGFLFILFIEKLCGGGETRDLLPVDTSDVGGDIRVKSRSSAIIGLMVHSAADGIALGAAVASSNTTSLEIMIFIAIMAHKGPTAFSFINFLLTDSKGKMDAKGINVVLWLFSLAAPSGAILTFAVMAVLHLAENYWSAIALLFSCGTFLNVATLHVLPSILEGECGGSLTWRQMMWFGLGSFLPLLTLHHHH